MGNSSLLSEYVQIECHDYKLCYRLYHIRYCKFVACNVQCIILNYCCFPFRNALQEEHPSESIDEAPPEPTEKAEGYSRMSKRAISIRSMENNDSNSHRRSSPQKIIRKKSSMKSGSPSPSQLVNAREEPASSVKTETKSTGPVK